MPLPPTKSSTAEVTSPDIQQASVPACDEAIEQRFEEDGPEDSMCRVYTAAYSILNASIKRPREYCNKTAHPE